MSVLVRLIEGTFLERWCIATLDWLNRILGHESQYGRKVFNPDTGEWDDTGERYPSEIDPCDPDEFT